MEKHRAKKLGFTHSAKMYGFDGYYYDDNGDESDTHETFVAKWIITNWIVEFMIHIEAIFGINNGFPILIKEKL